MIDIAKNKVLSGDTVAFITPYSRSLSIGVVKSTTDCTATIYNPRGGKAIIRTSDKVVKLK